MPNEYQFSDAIMDFLPQAILVIDVATVEIVYANAQYRQTLSGSAAARLAVSLFYRDAERAGTALSGDGPDASLYVDSEAEMEGKPGAPNWFRFRSRIITYTGRTYLLTNIIDIDRPERAGEVPKESETMFRHLSENANDVISNCTFDGTYTYVSPSFERLLGYRPEEVLGRSFFEFTHPEDRKTVISRHKEMTREGRKFTAYVLRFRHKSGHWEWLESSTTLIRRAEDQNFSEVVGVSRIITPRLRAEEELKASEAKFRLLSENASDLIASSTYDGTYTYASPSFERLLGYRPEEMLGKSIFEFMHPEDRPAYIAASKMMSKSEETYAAQSFRHRHKSGHWEWLESSLSVQRDGAGRISNVSGVSRLITERVRAEEALKASEARFRHLSDNANDLISSQTIDGTTTYVSPSYERLLGYRPEELLGRSFLDLVHPDDIGSVIAKTKSFSKSGEQFANHTCRVRHKSGHWEWLETAVTFERDCETGRISNVLTANRIITERVRAEDALMASEAKFRHLSENASDLIGISTYDGTYTYVSPSYERLLGYRQEEILGRSFFEFMHPDDRQAYIAASSKMSKSEENYSTQSYRFRHKSGHWEWVEASVSFQRDSAGRISTVSGVVRVITERIHAEEERRLLVQHISEEVVRMQAVLDTVIDGIITINAQGIIETFNRSAERIFGYKPEEVIGKNINLLMPEPYRSGHDGYVKHHIDTGEKKVIGIGREVQAMRKDGNIFPMELGINAFDYAGQRMFVGSIRDISERKRAEESLRASEEKFRLISESANDLIGITTSAGVFTYVSPSYEWLLGYRPDELLGKPGVEYVHPDDRGKIIAINVEMAATGERFARYDYRFRHKSGHWEWVEVSASLQWNASGKVSGMSGVARLITERVLAEAALKASEAEALRASEAKFRLLSENANDMISNATPDGTLLYASPSFERLTGYRPNEIIGRNLKDFVHPEDIDALQSKALGALLGNESYFTDIHRVRHKSGHWEWVEASVSISHNDGADGVSTIMAVTRVITERIRQREELQQALIQATTADRAKSDFLAHMSHELRTPLNAVIGFSEIMKGQMFGPLGSQQYVDYAKDINSSGQHLLSLINEVLDLSKVEAGKFDLHETQCRLDTIIETSCHLLRDRMEEKQLFLRVSLGANPDLWCDQRSMKQVLLNLVGNAIKFTPEGGVSRLNRL